MKLKEEDKNAISVVKLQRAKETISEANVCIQSGLWCFAVNRLYYACFYAVSALLIKNDFTAYKHTVVLNQFGLHFVAKGIISIEQGKFYKQLFNLRVEGDYDDWITIEAEDVISRLEPAQKFIKEIEKLINT